jgi:hypothetical protein
MPQQPLSKHLQALPDEPGLRSETPIKYYEVVIFWKREPGTTSPTLPISPTAPYNMSRTTSYHRVSYVTFQRDNTMLYVYSQAFDLYMYIDLDKVSNVVIGMNQEGDNFEREWSDSYESDAESGPNTEGAELHV